MAAPTYRYQPLAFAAVYPDLETSQTVVRGMRHKYGSTHDIRWYPREVRAGGARMTVYAVVVRGKKPKEPTR